VPDQPPRCIQQKHHQAAAIEVGRLQFSFGEIARAAGWIQQYGKIIRIVDQGLDRLVIVEGDAHVDFTVGEAKMSEPARRGFHALELIRMHEKHEFRPRRHRRDGTAPAERLRPETTVAHLATHELRTLGARHAIDQSQNLLIQSCSPSSRLAKHAMDTVKFGLLKRMNESGSRYEAHSAKTVHIPVRAFGLSFS